MTHGDALGEALLRQERSFEGVTMNELRKAKAEQARCEVLYRNAMKQYLKYPSAYTEAVLEDASQALEQAERALKQLEAR